MRAAGLVLAASDVATSLRRLVGGDVASRYRDEDEYYGIRLMVGGLLVTVAVALYLVRVLYTPFAVRTD